MRRWPPLPMVKLALLVSWNTAVLPVGGCRRKPSRVVRMQPSPMTEPLVSVKKRLGKQLVEVKRTAPPKPKVASGLAVVLLVNCPLMRSSEPGAMFQVAFCTVTLTPSARVLMPALLVRAPFNAIKFPFRMNPSLANCSKQDDSLLRLLVLTGRMEPLKIKLSAFTGAVPPQLAVVFQLASVPAPDQVRVAACACGSMSPTFSAVMASR